MKAIKCAGFRETRAWLMEQKTAKRVILLLLTAAVSFYAVFLLWLMPEMMETFPMDTKYWKVKIAAAVILFLVAFPGLLWGVYKMSSRGIALHPLPMETSEEKKLQKKQKRLWFLIGFCAVFAVLMTYYYAYFPGSYEWDTQDQWIQIQNGVYDTWHPPFHSLMIAFFAMFCNHYGFPVFMQLMLFSVLCGYLLSTMTHWGFPVWGKLLTLFFLGANPSTHRILLYMWKDSALTLFMLLFASYAIHVFLSKGQWLKKKRNLVAWILVLICISMVRHNGIFFTIPFLILAIFWMKPIRKECIVSLGIMLVTMFVIKEPIYDMMQVIRSDQVYVESVGVPMTVLCNLHQVSPESLDPEAREFLNSIGPERRWNIYEPGNYNTFKFTTNANHVIKDTPPLEFLGFTLRSVANAPGLSLQAVYQVTRMVWDLGGEVTWHKDLGFQMMDNEFGFAYVPERAGMRQVLEDFDQWIYDGIGNTIFSYNGLYLLILILSTLLVYARKGNRVLSLSFALLAYNIGTMLLLCGPTYRFFHFNCIITIPLCLMLFAKEQDAEGIKK